MAASVFTLWGAARAVKTRKGQGGETLKKGDIQSNKLKGAANTLRVTTTTGSLWSPDLHTGKQGGRFPANMQLPVT